jgi:plastocyanin
MPHASLTRSWAGALAASLLALLSQTAPASAQSSAIISVGDGQQISEYQFAPASIEARAGDTITWTNTGTQVHAITTADGSFDSGALAPGQSFSFSFANPGTYAYVCNPHPWMQGSITVLPAGE